MYLIDSKFMIHAQMKTLLVTRYLNSKLTYFSIKDPGYRQPRTPEHYTSISSRLPPRTGRLPTSRIRTLTPDHDG